MLAHSVQQLPVTTCVCLAQNPPLYMTIIHTRTSCWYRGIVKFSSFTSPNFYVATCVHFAVVLWLNVYCTYHALCQSLRITRSISPSKCHHNRIKSCYSNNSVLTCSQIYIFLIYFWQLRLPSNYIPFILPSSTAKYYQ